jgi:hypothetical protein
MTTFEIFVVIGAITVSLILAYYWIWGGTLTTFKWYRWLKGGIWYRYFPKMYPYMSF